MKPSRIYLSQGEVMVCVPKTPKFLKSAISGFFELDKSGIEELVVLDSGKNCEVVAGDAVFLNARSKRTLTAIEMDGVYVYLVKEHRLLFYAENEEID